MKKVSGGIRASLHFGVDPGSKRVPDQNVIGCSDRVFVTHVRKGIVIFTDEEKQHE